MNNFKHLALVGVLSTSLLLAACGQKKEANTANSANANTAVEETTNNKAAETETKDVAVSLSEWDGEWNNMGGYLDIEEVQPAFEELAKKEGVDAEAAKAAYIEKRKADFNGMKVEGDKVTFLATFPSENGDVLGEAEYKFVEAQEVAHGNATLEWDVFEATNENAPYKFLLMMPIHGEESLTHFHMRYGDDKDALLAQDGWFPTFVKPNTTNDQIMEEITE